jgi:O-acetylserine/cysteine efflux transporter
MKPADVVLAILTTALWGANFVASKLALAELPPLFLTGVRFAIVAAVLLPFYRVPRERLPRMALLGLVLGVGHFGISFFALPYVEAGTASLVLQTQVPLSALLASVVLGDRLHWRQWIGMAVAFTGVGLLMGGPHVADNEWAPALLVLSALMWSIANVQTKLLGPIHPYALTGSMALFAAPMLFALSFAVEGDDWARLQPVGWQSAGGLAYIVIASTLIAYRLWFALVQRYRVNQTTPFLLLIPVFGVLAGVLVLGERLTVSILAGGAIVIAGIAMVVLQRPVPEIRAEPE